MAFSVYLIAGEASGDNLGAALMRELEEKLGDEVKFQGVGGPKMRAGGLESLFPYHELSLMGFAEIVPHLAGLVMRLRQTVEDIIIKKPDMVITIDSPGFNFRVVKKLKDEPVLQGTRFVHYVAPTVWAYKEQRAKKCAEMFDHMLCLLPFEPAYFEKEGLQATFTGHPAAFLPKGNGEDFRKRNDIGPDTPLVCLMPGSRKNEIRRHMVPMARTIMQLSEAYPDIAMAVPVAQHLLPMVALYFKTCKFRTVLLGDEAEKPHAVAASTAALVKSGTVSLEVAAAGCPQVVTYQANRLTAMLLRRMIKIPYANLINITLNREVIPELLQERCTPLYLCSALEALLKYPHNRQAQVAAVAEAFTRMRSPDGRQPAQIAGEVIFNLLKNK